MDRAYTIVNETNILPLVSQLIRRIRTYIQFVHVLEVFHVFVGDLVASRAFVHSVDHSMRADAHGVLGHVLAPELPPEHDYVIGDHSAALTAQSLASRSLRNAVDFSALSGRMVSKVSATA